mmetsp:Transcript_12102/g.52011  ORF Transcript_12102/g.52011 Transcript_12102/m.52011 type:complete len:255 (+) Transcript_12102:1421-2185(+)
MASSAAESARTRDACRRRDVAARFSRENATAAISRAGSAIPSFRAVASSSSLSSVSSSSSSSSAPNPNLRATLASRASRSASHAALKLAAGREDALAYSYSQPASFFLPARCAFMPSCSGAIHCPPSATRRRRATARSQSLGTPPSPDASISAAWYEHAGCSPGSSAHRAKSACAAATSAGAPNPERSIVPAFTSPSPFPSSAARRKYSRAKVSFFWIFVDELVFPEASSFTDEDDPSDVSEPALSSGRSTSSP